MENKFLARCISLMPKANCRGKLKFSFCKWSSTCNWCLRKTKEGNRLNGKASRIGFPRSESSSRHHFPYYFLEIKNLTHSFYTSALLRQSLFRHYAQLHLRIWRTAIPKSTHRRYYDNHGIFSAMKTVVSSFRTATLQKQSNRSLLQWALKCVGNR